MEFDGNILRSCLSQQSCVHVDGGVAIDVWGGEGRGKEEREGYN